MMVRLIGVEPIQLDGYFVLSEWRLPVPPQTHGMARPTGFEPALSRVTGGCLRPLNDGRGILVGATGIEPATSCSQSRRSTRLSYTPMMNG